MNTAAELVRRHGLRGFDAVHLSSALLLYRVTDGACILVAADRQLLAPTTAEGLPVLDLR